MSADQPRRRPRPAGVAILLFAAAAFFALIVSLSLDTGNDNPIEITGAGEVQRLIAGIPQRHERLGEADAPITIQVLNDMQCGVCAEYQTDVIGPLIDDEVRGGEVKLEYRHYAVGSNATSVASFAAVAAGEQDHEWQYIQLFAINQDTARKVGVSDEFQRRIAAAVLELDTALWREDRGSSEVEMRVTGDAELTARLMLPAQPALIVDGPLQTRTLIESPTLDEIRAAIADVS